MNHLRILLADDHPDASEAMAEALRLTGHEAVGVLSGEAALAALAGTPFDALVVDQRMPGLSGVDTIRRARGQPGGSGMVAVLITAVGVDEVVELIRSTADLAPIAVLRKPTEIRELLSTIHQLKEGSP